MNLIVVVFLVIISAMGLVNYQNLSRQMRLSTQMNRATKQIHWHLILANLGIIAGCLLAIPANLMSRWIFGSTMCSLYGFEGFLTGMASINLVAVMAIDRFFLTLKKSLPINVSMMITFSWLSALLWSALPLFGFGKYSLEMNEISCGIDIMAQSMWDRLYMVTLVVLGFGAPITLAGVFNWSAMQHDSHRHRVTEIASVTASDISFNKTTCYILYAMVLCWSPYVYLAVFGTLIGQHNTATRVVSHIAPVSAKFGAAILPMFFPSVIP